MFIKPSQERDDSDAGQIHREARPVPGVHLQLYGDARESTGGSGLAAVLRNHFSDDTSDDPETGREGTHQSGPWAGPINQAPDRSR